MSGATFLDTETTDVSEDRQVIELAYWGPVAFDWGFARLLATDLVSQRFRPTKPIALGALAAHHILDEDLKDEPAWPGTWRLPEGTEYLIGHNVDFDWQSIGKPDVKRICTLALARKHWPHLDSHSLGALTYAWADSRERARFRLREAHSAKMDVVLLAVALDYIIERLKPKSWEELWRLSEHARIPTHFTFGKYGPQAGQPGIAIAEVRRLDPSYISWCLEKCDQCQDEYWQRALRGQV